MKPIQDLLIDPPFKGSRDYLHGSDIVPALLAATGPVQTLSIQFHRMARQPLLASEVDAPTLAELRSSQTLCVMLSCQDTQGQRRWVALTPSGRPATHRRIEHDETALVAGCRLDGQTVSHAATADPADFAARAIALNKYLLTQLTRHRHWVFSRLDMPHAPVAPGVLQLSLARTVGDGVYKSEIRGDDQFLGSMYFTRSAA